jgi:hypothetical protein
VRAPPVEIDGRKVLRFAVIDDDVRPTGATTHTHGRFVNGEVVPGPPMEPFAALAIIPSEDEGVYLLYLDHNWEEGTDTWHQTLDDAIRQAEFEYEGMAAKLRGRSETP